MNTRTQNNYQKNAMWIFAALACLGILCLVSIFLGMHSGENSELTADIYQDGKLLQSIPLLDVAEPYTITVTGENDSNNVIEVRNGSIGILSANCPDKLCVHQGFISSSQLPITCLPNKLVIQIHASGKKLPVTDNNDKITPDIITY